MPSVGMGGNMPVCVQLQVRIKIYKGTDAVIEQVLRSFAGEKTTLDMRGWTDEFPRPYVLVSTTFAFACSLLLSLKSALSKFVGFAAALPQIQSSI